MKLLACLSPTSPPHPLKFPGYLLSRFLTGCPALSFVLVFMSLYFSFFFEKYLKKIMHYKDFMSWSLHDCVKSKDRTDCSRSTPALAENRYLCIWSKALLIGCFFVAKIEPACSWADNRRSREAVAVSTFPESRVVPPLRLCITSAYLYLYCTCAAITLRFQTSKSFLRGFFAAFPIQDWLSGEVSWNWAARVQSQIIKLWIYSDTLFDADKEDK